MPLTQAEKQRRYRERLKNDPERREAYLKKERERWEDRKARGMVKTISEMSTLEQRHQRLSWRTFQAKCRDRKKMAKQVITPPASPQEIVFQDLPQFHSPEHMKKPDGWKSSKKISRKRYFKQQHMIHVSEAQADKYKRLANMYKKRWQRSAKQNQPLTPRTKTRHLLKHACGNMAEELKQVKRSLLFHHTLVQQVKEKYQSSEEKQKQMLRCLFTGGIIKKYRLQTFAKKQLHISKRNSRENRKKYISVSQRLAKDVQMFFERDDVSTMKAGKKETITRRKIKKQKRLLNDTKKN